MLAFKYSLPSKYYFCTSSLNPANTKHLYNICTTPVQRLRRWPNIVQTLSKCFVFNGNTFHSTRTEPLLGRGRLPLPLTSRHFHIFSCTRSLLHA